MALHAYRAKRNFKATPEPEGKTTKSGQVLRYVIQKHDARNLHYDFRLELDGVLKSWAVPKGPSLDPAVKRLAVQVEDHPIAYGDFEGVIPPHQYGSGKVMLWDRGTWQPLEDAAKGYAKGHLHFRLNGEKLKGTWDLIRMHHRPDDKRDVENWLLVKVDDDAARTGAAAEVTDELDKSVATGRLIDEIDDAPVAARASSRTNDAVAHTAAKRSRGKPTSPAESTLPIMVKPQLASLVTTLPVNHQHWIAEIKFDGYRMLARIEAGSARLYSRNAKDWTSRLEKIASELAQLPLDTAWLDGELVGVKPDGSMSFQSLQNAFADDPGNDKPPRLMYYIFDVLFLDGVDIRPEPLLTRKQKLAALLDKLPKNSALRLSDHLQGQMDDAFAHACHHGLEGLILKRADAPYESVRNRNWLKLKCQQRQEFVVGGFTAPEGSRSGFGALLLGTYDADGHFQYAGRVGTGFNEKMLKLLATRLEQLERKTAPFDDATSRIAPRERAHVHWVKPELVVEVRFAEWTAEKRLRQAAFLGLRPDKPAHAVVPETPVDVPKAPPEPAAQAAPATKVKAKPASQSAATDVAGVSITHPGRIVFPGTGDTKLAIARYYQAVADYVLPQLHDRPLTLVRCPQGAEHPCFFQKHLSDSLPEGLTAIDIAGESGSARYMIANDLHSVIALVQSGVLELHTWGSTAKTLEKPDRLIFDLDPAPEVAWQTVVEGAQLLKGLLEELDLPTFLKTTGGKGLHVEVPLKPSLNWEEAKALTHVLASHLATALPERFVAIMSKAQRTGRIFVDYLRNARGATAVAAYSTRARETPSVATPISWDELPWLESASFWTIHNVPDRLAQQKVGPWAEYDQQRVRLTDSLRQRFASS